jgi:hypothetical protein
MNPFSPPHLDDPDLIRILDHEPGQPADHAKAHVGECTTCAERLRVLEARTAAFSSLLERSKPALPAPPHDLWQRIARQTARVPARRRHWLSTGLLRAAALAGLLVTGALIAEPSRQWIIDRFSTTDTTIDPTQPIDQFEPVAAAAGFVPRSGTILIRIDSRQQDGTITLHFEERADVMGEVITDDPDADLLVLPPDGFHVRNEQGDTWSFRFRVPLGVRVQLQIAGVAVAGIEPTGTREVQIRFDEH